MPEAIDNHGFRINKKIVIVTVGLPARGKVKLIN